MEENRRILRIIIKGCFRSLQYDDSGTLFYFPIISNIADKWESLKPLLKEVCPSFTTHDFNRHIERIDDSVRIRNENKWNNIELREISNNELLNGEILLLDFEEAAANMRLVKMQEGEFLDVNTGRGYSFGNRVIFKIGSELKTSEGMKVGKIKSAGLALPSPESIVLGDLFIGKYYRQTIAASLWNLYNMGKDIVKGGGEYTTADLLACARSHGVGAYTLFNILKGAGV